MKTLEGLRYGDRWNTHVGCLEASLRYLSLQISPAWLYGGTGHAFAMCLGADLCPSGPHCWRQNTVYYLAQNLGFKLDGFFREEATEEALRQAREAEAAGIAALTQILAAI